MFEKLIACLPKLYAGGSGEWIVDHVNDGTPEHPKFFPYIVYSDSVDVIVHEIYNIMKEHPELQLNHYERILNRHGIKWGIDSMMNADVSSLDGQAVMALLMGVVRAERFCDGTLKMFLENGCIERWILRLKEIEEEQGKNL